MPTTTIIRDARVLTMCAGDARAPEGVSGRRGRELGELGVRDRHDVVIEDDKVVEVSPTGTRRPQGATEIDARGAVVMPGFVDCHTHACWAGSRIAEWERKLAGATYLEIMQAGGGIMSTVRSVRAATIQELEQSTLARLRRLIEAGTTTVEIKSGYGLTQVGELQMLEAIGRAKTVTPMTVLPTALLGHAIDGDEAAFVRATIDETLPAVASRFPRITVDAFCEKGAWSPADATSLLKAAAARGMPVRVHADQFNAMGMLEAAVAMGARSVDHLEASTPEGLRTLAASETFGVMLPACGFHLDGRYADGRAFVDAGGKLAIASNLNPGSAPCYSMPMIIALAVRHLKLSPAEAIGAATVNGAAVLGFADRGWLGKGARADVLLLKTADERALAYEFGGNLVDRVMVGGELV